MELKVSNLLKIISYGRYSKPFLNYLIENDDREDFVYFYKSRKLSLLGNHEDTFAFLEKIIDSTSNNSLKFLSISSLLNSYINIKDLDNIEKCYNYLIDNFENIPEFLRGNISTTLISIKNSIYDRNYKTLRAWSHNHKKNLANKPFKYFAQARKKTKAGEHEEAFEIYGKGFEIALSYPHPTAISVALNDSTWNIKNHDFKLAQKQCKKLEYYDGYYIRGLNFLDQDFDTICHIKRKEKDINYLEYYYLYLYSISKIKHFNKLYEKLDNTVYKNSKNLRYHLKKYYYNLDSKSSFDYTETYNKIIRNQKSEIKSDEIQNLIKSLKISFNANQPDAINYELFKNHINIKFDSLKTKYLRLPFIKRKIFILSTYMAYIETPDFIDLKYLFDYIKDNNNSFDYYNTNNKRKKFFVDIFKPVGFLKGRKDLIINALIEMRKNERLKNFFNFYLNLKPEHQNIFNDFLRNYSRYHIDFRFSLREYLPDIFYSDNSVEWKRIIKNFCMDNGLFFRTAFIAFWCFDKEKRKLFLDIINRTSYH